tara:strand:- start:6001 stop:6189 length:189 start_codon:yes stop_codon:yes gene_type:complete
MENTIEKEEPLPTDPGSQVGSKLPSLPSKTKIFKQQTIHGVVKHHHTVPTNGATENTQGGSK